MTLTKTNIGTNDDGSARYHYHCDGHVMFTGPITGSVTCADGTVYDVTDEVIEVAEHHRGEVAHRIGVRHEDEGHPKHQPTPGDPDPHPFLHTCTDHCGKHADKHRKIPVLDRLRAMGRDV